MFYLDTSVLVAALTNERTTQRVLSWLAQRDPMELFVSEWTITEMSSAMGIKVRTGRVTPDDRTTALAAFNAMLSDSFQLLPVKSNHFWLAAEFADHPQLALRGGDALHLAVAFASGTAMATLDRRLADASPVLGVVSELVA